MLKDEQLKKLLFILKNPPKVRVGILGNKNARPDGKSNATIGLKHEFGLYDATIKQQLPVRSFLRMPLIEKLQDKLEESKGLFTQKVLKQCMEEKSLAPYLKNLGIVAERTIADAFHTGGFGKWKVSNMRFKTNHQTLVESGKLRDSISSEVV